MFIDGGHTRRSSFFPWRDAAVCLECRFVSSTGYASCCVCGSPAMVSLSEVISEMIENIRLAVSSGIYDPYCAQPSFFVLPGWGPELPNHPNGQN